MNEIWRKHPDIENYKFSNLGNISIPNQIKTPKASLDGYVKIMIKGKKYSLHRIIAEIFCEGKSEERNIVDHINGLRDDNRACNLRWVSISENCQNRRTDGIFKKEHLEKSNVTYLKLYDDKSKMYNKLMDDYIFLHKLYLEQVNNYTELIKSINERL